MIDILRQTRTTMLGAISWLRLLPLRCLGLRAAPGVQNRGGIRWPWGNLRNIQLDKDVALGAGGWFFIPLHNRTTRIQIGAGTAVGDNFIISANNSIRVGRECLLAYRVSLLDHSHGFGWDINPVKSELTVGSPIDIGDKCFIGCNVVILPGVRLGKNCIVGANSVVTSSFEEGSVIAGAPARLLRKIGPSTEVKPLS